MAPMLHSDDPQQFHRLRLSTLIRLRWLAIIGQSLAVIFVAYWLDFPLPISACFALIAASAWLNLFLVVRYPATQRLAPHAALASLLFDAFQLGGLLFLTGGLTNPFALLVGVPVVISATSLPPRMTLLLGGLVGVGTTFLTFYHLPLPWYAGVELTIPLIYIAGMWISVLASTAFTAVFVWRVADEARQLGDALAATELVLQREQHLSALDGLAAAAAHELGTPLATIALVAKEMERSLGQDERYRDDVTLLRSQSERCRGIMKRLTSLSTEDEAHLRRLPFTSLIEEVTAPHRDFGIAIDLEPGERVGPEPVGRRNPGVIYGLGNLVENAIDFARTSVTVRWRWNEEKVVLEVIDDGTGFPPDIIHRIGEPYMTTRAGGSSQGGLGLGLFIAKTLIERSGATILFRNADERDKGASVLVTWPRSAFRDEIGLI